MHTNNFLDNSKVPKLISSVSNCASKSWSRHKIVTVRHCTKPIATHALSCPPRCDRWTRWPHRSWRWWRSARGGRGPSRNLVTPPGSGRYTDARRTRGGWRKRKISSQWDSIRRRLSNCYTIGTVRLSQVKWGNEARIRVWHFIKVSQRVKH